MQTRNRSKSDWVDFANPLGIIRLILLVDWDPIGVFGHTETMDEYDRYALEVYDLLVSDATQNDIADYLRQVQTERMEVGGNPSMALATVATKLREAYGRVRADQ